MGTLWGGGEGLGMKSIYQGVKVISGKTYNGKLLKSIYCRASVTMISLGGLGVSLVKHPDFWLEVATKFP